MLKRGLGLLAFGICASVALADEKDKTPIKVTADEIAKEFKDDAAAAKTKYGAKPLPELQISGSATSVIGVGKDSELLVETSSKTTIRIAVDKRPAKFPAKFTATATYKDFFSMNMVQELSLKASKVTYGK
jgi:hypothetical protein